MARQTPFFETSNRKLEQFLHAHLINFLYQYKNDDYLTVWVYDRTPRLTMVLNEYRDMMDTYNRAA